jgi:trk system potassium uptake protein TrkH
MRLIFDPRPILMNVGSLLLVMACFMTAPLVADLAAKDGNWPSFLVAAAAAAFVGVALVLASRGHPNRLTIRESILLTVTSWLVAPAIGAVPLLLSIPHLTLSDAFFEATSAMTTTGSTVLTGLDRMPAGILLWRAILQWIGGIGIIVMGIALMPLMRTGGIRLFRLESSERGERVMPRVQNFIVMMVGVYLVLTVACALAYMVTGLSPFDAICHAMTTLSTGGFANYDNSFEAFDNAAAEWVAVVFMISGSIPFFLYISALRGGPMNFFANRQVRGLFAILLLSILAIALWLWVKDGVPALLALRLSAFNVTSIVTTTGYASTDYTTWGSLPVGLFFFLTFVGGCTGSTAGGIKILRFQIVFFELRNTLQLLLSPNSVRRAGRPGQPSDPESTIGAMVFVLAFLLTIAGVSILLEFLGYDIVTAVTAATTAVANVGPGLGTIIGPAGNFAPLPDAAMWILAAAMLLGRLELFAIFVLFTRQFWRF